MNKSRITYPESIKERISPKLEDDLKNRTTSLGNHPIFPDSDETHFEEKLISKRFEEVVNRVKRNYNVDEVDTLFMLNTMNSVMRKCVMTETKHNKKLVDIAIKYIRDEYDMSEEDVDIQAELMTYEEVDNAFRSGNTNLVGIEGHVVNESPMTDTEMTFDKHSNIMNANAEVQKRRFINAMIQGSAKKNHHIFNMMEEELSVIDPTLINSYGKLMSAADYFYFCNLTAKNSFASGKVHVVFPVNENEKPIIKVKAITFPVLIHELTKGVMEILSSHGLPNDGKMRKYVVNRADYFDAEPWDMRLGPGIWGRFMESIDSKDLNIKHHIYSELVSLPVNEFNSVMKEIMAGTKEGKKIISDIASEVRLDLQKDEFNSAMNEYRNSYNDSIDDPEDLDDIDLDDFR